MLPVLDFEGGAPEPEPEPVDIDITEIDDDASDDEWDDAREPVGV
jgi:hypothetical protein